VLSRFGFLLVRGGDVGDKGDMNEQAVFTADVDGELADGFDEGQTLNVADRAADFDDRYVVAGLAAFNPVLDFVGDVGDNLDGGALVVRLCVLSGSPTSRSCRR